MIRTEQLGRVRRLTLAAPLRRNVMDRALADQFLTALTDAEGDPGTGAVLVEAEGPVFCGGMDFANPPRPEFFQFGPRASKPVVAMVQGVATSAGVALLANCHIVIAAQGSSFGLTDLRDGRHEKALLAAVAEAVGARRARELALTARIFSTPEALQWGLVHATTPAVELEERALAVAQGLARAEAAAVRAILSRQT
jgi:enoyl-CoA hydratase/carnithine racemase